MKIAQIKVKIISNREIRAGYWRADLSSPDIAQSCCPGQFINIKVNAGMDPLLRRPLSIHRAGAGKISILYEVLGPATKILSLKKPGEHLDIIGPLGNGFTIPHTRSLAHPLTILVAGGMGVAPLVFLAQKLAERKMKSEKRKTIVLIGARAKNQILCADEFKKLGCEVKIATDDGSRGFKGKVTELLAENLRLATRETRHAIYTCGPSPMLKSIAWICAEANISAQLSLEAHMACGIGACLGCVVKTKSGMQRVCKEGPVFAAQELIW